MLLFIDDLLYGDTIARLNRNLPAKRLLMNIISPDDIHEELPLDALMSFHAETLIGMG